MQGKIVKGISGFYYVHVAGTGIYECKAKGIFRNQKKKPLVGDDVRIAVLDEKEHIGNVEELLPRKNELIRPAVANIDQALVIFAAAKPEPNLNLMDRFLCMMEYQRVPAVICFNKCDLITKEEEERLSGIYAPAGYEILFTSAKTGKNTDRLKKLLTGRTTAVAGPSGVGKSSLVNLTQDQVSMETGRISDKIQRGKHTTRHSELIAISGDTYIMDTPGFSSLEVPGLEPEQLWTCFPEFVPCEPMCRFTSCSHISEPGCGVKEALEQGRISRERYEHYVLFYEEMKQRRKY
ncbi:MAG: ribosome small subunit-dependent GTPase A [Agathobacter sp.]